MSAKETSASLAGNVLLGAQTSVHRLGFGAARLTGEGIWGPPENRAEAIAVLRRAVELGVNFIDTADSYGPNVSEELIAEALFPYPPGLVIATKGGWNRPGPDQWTHDATPSHLRKAVEGSLRRLRLERIDLYQLHIPDPVVPFDDSIGTLAQLRSEGKIRLIGLSNVTQEHIDRARRIVPIVSVQNRYSLADREWDYLVDHCELNGIAFIPWFPLAAGRMADKILNQVARAHGCQRSSGGACLAVHTIADHVAHPGNFVGETSRGERCCGRPTIERRRICNTKPSAPVGSEAAIVDPES